MVGILLVWLLIAAWHYSQPPSVLLDLPKASCLLALEQWSDPPKTWVEAFFVGVMRLTTKKGFHRYGFFAFGSRASLV